jgi:hypothetical protein
MRSSLLLLFPVVLRITGVAAFSPVKQRNNNRQCQSSVCGSEVSRYLTAHGSTFGLHVATYVVAVERNPDKARLVCKGVHGAKADFSKWFYGLGYQM